MNLVRIRAGGVQAGRRACTKAQRQACVWQDRGRTGRTVWLELSERGEERR